MRMRMSLMVFAAMDEQITVCVCVCGGGGGGGVLLADTRNFF